MRRSGDFLRRTPAGGVEKGARSTIVTDSSPPLESLVLRLHRGDAEASELLDAHYRAPIQRFCLGYLRDEAEAEDATQEILCKVLRSDEVPRDFRAWLYRIARNHCLNVRRGRDRRRDGAALPERSIAALASRGPLSRVAYEESLGRLSRLLESMPEAQREVLRLRYVEDLSRSEIAVVLDLPESVVKSRLFEGMKKLREHTSLYS